MSKVLAWEKIFANPIHHFNFCIAYLRTLENSLNCDNLDKTATATIAVAWLALSQRSIKKTLSSAKTALQHCQFKKYSMLLNK